MGKSTDRPQNGATGACPVRSRDDPDADAQVPLTVCRNQPFVHVPLMAASGPIAGQLTLNVTIDLL